MTVETVCWTQGSLPHRQGLGSRIGQSDNQEMQKAHFRCSLKGLWIRDAGRMPFLIRDFTVRKKKSPRFAHLHPLPLASSSRILQQFLSVSRLIHTHTHTPHTQSRFTGHMPSLLFRGVLFFLLSVLDHSWGKKILLFGGFLVRFDKVRTTTA